MLDIRIHLATIGQIRVALVIQDGIDLPIQIKVSIP